MLRAAAPLAIAKSLGGRRHSKSAAKCDTRAHNANLLHSWHAHACNFGRMDLILQGAVVMVVFGVAGWIVVTVVEWLMKK